MNIIRKLFGPAVSKIIMPAQKKEDTYAAIRTITMDGNVKILNHFIPAPNASINVAEFTANPDLPLSHKKIIIFSVGNNGNYEQYFYDYIKLARENPHWHIVGFNYRNVLASKGKAYSEQDWVDDAKYVIQYFKNQNCSNENILICGHSLGGAIVTMAASQLYQEEQNAAKTNEKSPQSIKSIRCINDRSFANLSKEIVISLLGHTRSSIINALIYGIIVAGISLAWAFCFPLLGGLTILSSVSLSAMTAVATFGISLLKDSIAYGLLRPWVTILLDLTFGRMDAFSHYQILPEESKSYLIVKNDTVIKKASSLYFPLKSIQKNKIQELWREWKVIEAELNRTPIKPEEIIDQQRAIERKLVDIKDAKLRHATFPHEGKLAHIDPLHFLITYSKIREQLQKPQKTGDVILNKKITNLLQA